MEVLIYTSTLDDRFKVGQVNSRIGLAADADLFDEIQIFLVK